MLTQADVHWLELDSVDSTNDYLRREYLRGQCSGVVAVLAHSQTAGRGRAGRSWLSLPGAGLYMSIGLPMAGHSAPYLPLCVGVAVAQVLEKLQLAVRLKWPNDLLLGQQKLGGILCESFQSNAGPLTVIGLGLNLLSPTMSDALGGQGATGLFDHREPETLPSSRELASQFVSAILNVIKMVGLRGFGDVSREFNRLDAWLGCDVQLGNNEAAQLHGKAMGINDQGAYLINTEHQGLLVLNAGDLSLRRVLA